MIAPPLPGGRYLLRRVVRNAAAVFAVTFAVTAFPRTIRFAILAALVMSSAYLGVQLVLTRFCGACGLPAPVRPWISRAGRCPGCGGEYRLAWQSRG